MLLFEALGRQARTDHNSVRVMRLWAVAVMNVCMGRVTVARLHN